MTNPVQSGDFGSSEQGSDTHRVAETPVVSGHTPGPWRYRAGYIEHENRSGFWQPIKLYSPWVQGAWETDAEAAANALVAAAAPDLLEALTYARTTIRLSLIMNGEDENGSAIIARIDAAIAKATGENL